VSDSFLTYVVLCREETETGDMAGFVVPDDAVEMESSDGSYLESRSTEEKDESEEEVAEEVEDNFAWFPQDDDFLGIEAGNLQKATQLTGGPRLKRLKRRWNAIPKIEEDTIVVQEDDEEEEEEEDPKSYRRSGREIEILSLPSPSPSPKKKEKLRRSKGKEIAGPGDEKSALGDYSLPAAFSLNRAEPLTVSFGTYIQYLLSASLDPDFMTSVAEHQGLCV